jgi:DNA-binding SARP family transcriptional activator/tetratricopeptide (TPR) repeat protein
MVRFSILGPIELCDGERRVAVLGSRQVALLALLLVNANRALSSDQLIEALWGNRRGGAVKRLHVTIARLRRTLDAGGVQDESALRTVAGGYLLAVRPGELDAEVFQTRVEEGRRALEAGEAARARDLFGDALGMWRGPALAAVAYEAFAQPEIRRLEELRLSALEARVECKLCLGEHGGLTGELEVLVAAHPGRERLAGQLMLALYRGGRQGDALEVYARTRAYLSGELGLEPGPALRSLQAEILAQSPALQRDEPGSDSAADPPAAEEVAVLPTVAGGRSSAAAGPVMLPLPRSLHPPAGLPFVGRDAELEHLHECWTGICGIERAAVVLGGEAGIGKTRLAAELAGAVHREGAQVLYGRCDEGLAVPYQPFVEALRPYARAAGHDRLRTELGELAPELGRLLPELAGLGEPLRADPESERYALFEAVTALLEAATREQRMLLVLDDLHWAANPTLLLLRHLIRSERPVRVLLLGTYRETELDAGHQLVQLLADLQRDASVQLLSIGGLGEPAIAALLEAAVGHTLDEGASQLVRVLGAQTAGNPFFVRELLAHVAGSDDRLSAGVTAVQFEAPEGLRHVIGQRVARLSPPAGCALSVAAVAGATFSFVILEHVLGECSGVLDALDEAVTAGLLTEAGRGDHAFAHALVRQTIYGQLGSARRMRLHRQLGEALEALGDADADVGALAHHFAQAAADGQGVKAAMYALAAGRSATARLGHYEAAAHYERGLEALALSGQPQQQQRCELLLALGDASWAAGELDKARQACQQAAELAEKLGDASRLARAAIGFCGPHRFEVAAGVTRRASALLERALAALGDDDTALRAQLVGRLADYKDVERKPVLARQALETARRVGDSAALADVLASTHRAIRGPDALHESLAVTQELGRVADDAGDRRMQARALGWSIDLLLELGDIEAVERELEALQRLTETRRERFFTWFLTVYRANHAYLQGRIEHCETLAHDALTHRFEGQDETAAHIFEVQMLFVRREQGRLDELVEKVEGFAAQYRQLASWRYAPASVYAHLGRAEQAHQALESLALDDFEDLPRDAFWLWNLSTLCEVVVFLGDAPRAQLFYELLLPYADRCVVAFGLLSLGSASRPLGQLATTLSRYEEAARHFEYALEMNTQIRSPLWVAHTRHDYARMLLLRNRPGDRDKAVELLEQALATAEQLGLKALADKARPLKLTAETAAPPQVRRRSA